MPPMSFGIDHDARVELAAEAPLERDDDVLELLRLDRKGAVDDSVGGAGTAGDERVVLRRDFGQRDEPAVLDDRCAAGS
jgi:hypothetical protein